MLFQQSADDHGRHTFSLSTFGLWNQVRPEILLHLRLHALLCLFLITSDRQPVCFRQFACPIPMTSRQPQHLPRHSAEGGIFFGNALRLSAFQIFPCVIRTDLNKAALITQVFCVKFCVDGKRRKDYRAVF